MKFYKDKILKFENDDVFKIKFVNNNNYSIEFFNYGGYFNSVCIPYKDNKNNFEDVILGYKNINDYLNDKISLNALVGRVCGRIANSSFYLNNKNYKLNSNENNNHIHGGIDGFNKKVWNIESINKDDEIIKCSLSYMSKHLEEGYPGNLKCNVNYSLNNKNEIKIDLNAECDQDTIVNMTNHNYWNFHGHRKNYQNIKNHLIKINSEYICEVNEDLIPSGNLLSVKKTKYDFNNPKLIDEFLLKDGGIDTCFEINNEKKMIQVAEVYSNITKMGMQLSTNQPGLHFYTGNMMEDKYNGKYNKNYGNQYGLCIEAQIFPDAINHSNFISPILKQGDIYKSSILIKLKNDF